MSHYNFSTLTDRDFERLVNDIISEIENKQIEEFTSGRDSGIDGRFVDVNNRTVVIQAKHFWKSGIKKLINYCKSTEVEKVKSLEPDRYIFVCSSGLTPINKNEIKNIFSPYILYTGDIYGESEITSFLDKPENYNILMKNHKLWLTSSNVLSIFQNAALYNSSRFKLEDIKNKAKLYVTTSSHYKAYEKLELNHCLVITGDPGVGKTTLAEQMCNLYVSKGFVFYEINEIEEAFEVVGLKEKQVFFFDDFLGANYLEAIEKNKDSKVVRLINVVKRSDEKRFILTSRSSILNQGKNKSQEFHNGNIDSEEFLLNISELTLFNKAEILYNHIYFSNLNEDIYRNYFINKNYRFVVNHKNFNPRIIEFLTDEKKLLNVDSLDYWSYVQNSLENPTSIWKIAINNQLKSHQRIVLYILCISGGLVETNIRSLYDVVISDFNISANSEMPFIDAVEVLTGSYINREVTRSIIRYELLNPSLADYLIPKLLSEVELTSKLILSMWPEYLNEFNLKKFFGNGVGFKKYTKKISEVLLKSIKDLDDNKKYMSLVYILLSNYVEDSIDSVGNIDFTRNFVSELNSVGIKNTSYLKIVERILESENFVLIKSIDWDEVLYISISLNSDHDDLVDLSRVIKECSEYIEDMDMVVHELSQAVIGYWEGEIQSRVAEELDIEILLEYPDKDDVINEIESISDSVCDEIISEYYVDPKVSHFELTAYLDVEELFWDLVSEKERRGSLSLEKTLEPKVELSDVDRLFAKKLNNR